MAYTKSINHYIVLGGMLIKRVFFKVLAENKIDITPDQWIVLYLLSENDTMTIGELSELTFKDNANTSRISQKLLKHGYIEKIKNPLDKRIVSLKITEVGRLMKNDIEDCALRSTEICTKGIDKEDINVMFKNLNYIIKNSNDYL